MPANYKDFVPFILRWEGGEVNDPADRGGHTNRGITRSTYNQLSLKVLGVEPSTDNFRNLTREDATAFILHFWNGATGGNRLISQGVSEIVTAMCWGSGYKTGQKLFQKHLKEVYNANILIDGCVGPKTALIANKLQQKSLLQSLILSRAQFFEDICISRTANKRFINGWLNRLEDFAKRHQMQFNKDRFKDFVHDLDPIDLNNLFIL